ncbi:MAG: hypothetical protein CEN92_365 [Candidatus Berkelbacteria bacterium Licking1014_96]|uniref:Uncharacterized protein n=1 Tax=Candidatus Berkelbacteria bacterium Licking1014_96 TaxID=2017149 RepID=A0A554LD86_9BACT|nr:MAG: hypothetical protein CEN92_365 [Candidatus Berkelbacteria bacterium Licking1014_96]
MVPFFPPEAQAIGPSASGRDRPLADILPFWNNSKPTFKMSSTSFSPPLTPITGISSPKDRALAVATPTLVPVNDPGPILTMIKPKFWVLILFY